MSTKSCKPQNPLILIWFNHLLFSLLHLIIVVWDHYDASDYACVRTLCIIFPINAYWKIVCKCTMPLGKIPHIVDENFLYPPWLPLLGSSKKFTPHLVGTGFSMSKESSSILLRMVSLTLASNGHTSYTSSRIQRWVFTHAPCEYTIRF